MNEKHLAIMTARMQAYSAEAEAHIEKRDLMAAAIANAKSKAIGSLITEIWKSEE